MNSFSEGEWTPFLRKLGVAVGDTIHFCGDFKHSAKVYLEKTSQHGSNDQYHEIPIILDTLSNDLLLENYFLSEVVDLFDDRKQAIFYGPPGTGKTYIARQLANYLTQSIQDNGISPWSGEPARLMMSMEQRQYASNKIYDDVESNYYSWDSTVPNHEQINAGIFYKGETVSRYFVVTSIMIEETEKERGRCPEVYKLKPALHPT